MAEVKWIKLASDVFENRKIRQIESLPDGDSIIVIWVKLLCLAGNINDSGLIYFTKEIPYTDNMLSTEFGRPLPVIQLALKTFENFGMIETIDNIWHISNWEKYQNTDKLKDIREYNRLAQQKRRAKQKSLESGDVNDNVNDMSMTSQTCQDTDIDIDKDKDKDILSLNSPMFKGEEKAENVQNSVQNIKTYGTHQNVKMSDKQYKQLKTAYPDADYTIDRLSDYIADTQKYSTFHNHLVVLMKWAEEDARK